MTMLPRLVTRERVTTVDPRQARQLLLSMLALALLVLVTAGCGSSDNGVAAKSASEILQATRTAAQSASSVHVVSSAKSTRGGSLTLDASLATDQGHAKVTFFGFSLQAIRTGDTIYVKGNELFAARMGAALGVKVPANTWIKGPAKGTLGHAAGTFTNITTELPVMLAGTGKVTKGAKTSIDGQPTIALELSRKLYSGNLYVATTGQPYPLKLVKTGPGDTPGFSETGQTTFTGWNDPVTVTPPANAVDIAQLQPVKKKH
jgi:hypothetical protein